MKFLGQVAAALLGCSLALYAIRFSQRWFVCSVANLLEYSQPEREPKGNGRWIIASVPLSGAALLYLVGAWSAFCTIIPLELNRQCPSLYSWVNWIVALVVNFVIAVCATKMTMGFGHPEEANSFVRTETMAHFEKADNAFGFAMLSSWLVWGASIALWIFFMILPGVANYLYAWLLTAVTLISG